MLLCPFTSYAFIIWQRVMQLCLLSNAEGLATQSHKNEEKTVFEVIHLLQKVHKGQRICFIKGLKV